MSLPVVVLLSGSGSLLQSLLDAIDAGDVDAQVVAVGSDRADAQGLQRATDAGIATFVHPYAKGSDREAWDRELTDKVAAHRPALVVSAGFMKLVGATFLARYGGAMINTHPALLPSFPGMHGPRDALAYGVKITGATVFMVDEGVDTGTILAQRAVAVSPEDSVESLHERIKVAERALLNEVVSDLALRHRNAAEVTGSTDPSTTD